MQVAHPKIIAASSAESSGYLDRILVDAGVFPSLSS